jgi:hypothetical protein
MKKIVALAKPETTITSRAARAQLFSVFEGRSQLTPGKILTVLMNNYAQRKAAKWGYRTSSETAQEKFDKLAEDIVNQKRNSAFISWARKGLSRYAGTREDLTLPACIKIKPIEFLQGDKMYTLSALPLKIPAESISQLLTKGSLYRGEVPVDTVVYLQTGGCIISISYNEGDFFEFNYISSIDSGQINLGTPRRFPIDQPLMLGSAEYSDIPIPNTGVPDQACAIKVEANPRQITITKLYYIKGISTEVSLYKREVLS